jgi:RNA polymerase sigma-70 factor (ECF subfamily)
LIDHHRRAKREKTKLRLIAGRREHEEDDLPCELSSAEAHAALQALSTPHRLALMLRYLDDLSVADVARLLGKSVRATESLLARARTALRTAYEEQCDAR